MFWRETANQWRIRILTHHLQQMQTTITEWKKFVFNHFKIGSHACSNRNNVILVFKIIRPNSESQQVFCQECKNASECITTDNELLSPLRQWCVENAVKLIETQEAVLLNIKETNGIDFVSHVEDIRNSECSCVEIEHFYLTRCRFRDSTSRRLEIINRIYHYAFSSQIPIFCNCCNHDYYEDVWQGITIVKRQSNRTLCKNKADTGLGCITDKSIIISFSKTA